MTCPYCGSRFAQNWFGHGNTKCTSCNKEYNLVVDREGDIMSPMHPEPLGDTVSDAEMAHYVQQVRCRGLMWEKGRGGRSRRLDGGSDPIIDTRIARQLREWDESMQDSGEAVIDID